MDRWGTRTGGEGRAEATTGAEPGPGWDALSPIRVVVAGEPEGTASGVAEFLAGEPAVRVAASVTEGALEVVRRERPHLVCLDLDARAMDALGFLQDLMACLPTPVVVVSGGNSRIEVFRALELGALEFVPRPVDPGGVPAFQEDLRARVRMVRGLQRDTLEIGEDTPRPEHVAPERLVVIGGAGADPAELTRVLADLPPGIPLSVVVAQHAPMSGALAQGAPVGRSWGFRFFEAGDGKPLVAGEVLLAPAGRHLQVERARGAVSVRVLESSEVAGRRHCPSIDLLFESAARSFADRACGVLLAGANGDGRRGAVAIRAVGGLVLAEHRGAEAEADAELVARFDEVLGHAEISRRLVRFARGG